MSGVSVHIDDSAARQALRALSGQAKNLLPVFDEIGGAMTASTLQRFESGTAPNGSPWLPSQRALRQGGKTLVDKGHLRDSLVHQASNSYVDIGTNLIYAGIHQFGGKTGRAGAVEMPARPYLGLSDDDNRDILDIVAKHLRKSGAIN